MEKNNINRNIIIAYHYPCFDGSYSALNAFKYYENFSKSKANITFHPLNSYNRISEINLKNALKIYILDKGLNDEDLKFIYNILKNDCNKLKIVILDHHKSSIDYFNNNFKDRFKAFKNIKTIFDDTESKSACGLTLDYFKKKSLKNFSTEKVDEIYTERYKFLNNYVEDSDTGKFVLKFTHEFKSGLSSYLTPLKVIANFNTGFRFLKMFYQVDVESIIRQGDKQYKKYKKNSKNEIAGKNCYIVELINENSSSEKWKFIACFTQKKQYRNHACPILSQISLAKGFSPIGAFVYHCEKNIYKMSMRTHSNDIDLGYICSLFGGGGHTKASAFSKESQFFDNIIIGQIDLYKVLQNYS